LLEKWDSENFVITGYIED